MYDARAVSRYFLLRPHNAVANGAPALVIDLSVKGARLELFRPLPPGSGIELTIGTVHLNATVLWSEIDSLNLTDEADRYVAGVMFSEPSPAIGRLIDDLSARNEAIKIVDARSVDRFRLIAPLTGSFGEIAPVSVIDLSIRGARIKVSVELAAGEQGVLRFQVDDETGLVDVPGTVMWCASAQMPREFEAGLKIEKCEAKLRAAIQRLCMRDEARIDLLALKRKFDALRLEARIAELSPHAATV